MIWRAYVPRWSYQPLSGAGAARFGGRWNPVGAPAIYAGVELSTAWSEYNQGFVQHPALIAQLSLTNARLADLTQAATLERFAIAADIHDLEWRAVADEGRTPETWAVRNRLLRADIDGVVYPSVMSRGGRCVCLWRWNEPGATTLVVIDPDQRLPRSPASWV